MNKVKNFLSNIILLGLLVNGILLCSCTGSTNEEGDDLDGSIDLVDKPDQNYTNEFYISNRAPLKPSAFIKLPVSAIKPKGWLLEYLKRQQNGLTGNLGKISAWLQKENNAWLSADGKGEWGWEEVPYWLKGYAHIGYILDDPEIIDEAKIWLEAAINSQREDGNFGPVRHFGDGSQDFWANMIMLYCLQSYYEYSSDQRVINLMTDYFKYQLTVPDEEFLTHYWQRIRGGDNLHSVFWLYNRTGEAWLLDLAKKIHRNTADWTGRGHDLSDIHNRKEIREGLEWPAWYGDLIDWHNVNVAQAFREPAQYYLLSHDEKHLKASYDNFDIIRKHFGQVPGGMFGSDENSRPGFDDPRQGIETCGIVEQMNSNEHLLRITGDVFWADHAEEVAFNTYPAAVTADFKALRYITSPNMVLNDDQNHNPGIDNSGPFLMMNPFSSRCCQHNHAQGWPYFNENLWMATPDNGIAAVIYSASEVSAKVGDGTEVTITEISNYPFEEDINFKISSTEPVMFPLYLRIPAWAKAAELHINGEKMKKNLQPGKYVRIDRTWNNGDKITLKLPMELNLKTWKNNHNSVSVNYGPLTFSLKISENYIRKESDETAIWDSKWQKGVDTKQWPSFEIHPASPWNYGLVLQEDLKSTFEVNRKAWPENDFPFTTDAVPIALTVKARKIPAWKIDEYGLAGELKDSPVWSEEPEEKVQLIPMGAARLRISAFPVAGKQDNAHRW
ncbi:glycoside hydrolase family 127 protein [Fulvivirgaceae bacterium BMA10]|uniref:Glycoside hydrolase family 127 protein n=1 Tax=Splendidivirga corallicola TaxID=3051826 RepID=A0ABT8KMF1_9BACT|nr:glycoside hydrolase family 127 protein [Fulvivirgaceae bacterium BMA10]